MLKNLKLGKKLLVSFLLVAILGSISGIVASSALKYVSNEYDDALRNFGFAQGDIGQAILQVSQIQADTIKIVSYTVQEDIASAKQDLENCRNEYMQILELVRATLSDEHAQKLFSNIESLETQYTSLRDQIISLGNTIDVSLSKQAQIRLEDELEPLYQEFYGAWNELAEYKTTKGDTESDRLTNVGTTMQVICTALVVVSLLISALLGTYLSRSIGTPIRESAERLVKLSKGDLRSPMPKATSNDETKDLIEASATTVDKLGRVIRDIDYQLNAMGTGNFAVDTKDKEAYVGDLAHVLESIINVKNAVNDALLQVDTSVDQVNSGGEQVSSGAQALAQGATEQASSVQELAATINQISTQIKATADHAKVAEKENRAAGDELGVCSHRMNELVAAMQVIDGKSKEIGKVVKTIEDIAFQTNILALNAAVEAARAGSAGKGFAVVADEVRNLATKSQEAAKSTTSLIDETVRAVSEGTRLSGETEASLKQVVDNADKVLDAVVLISSATDEQAHAVEQVSTGIDQISSVVQTNSATAEESAAASQELSGQANLLKELVGKFTLNRDGHSISAAPKHTDHSTVSAPEYAGAKY